MDIFFSLLLFSSYDRCARFFLSHTHTLSLCVRVFGFDYRRVFIGDTGNEDRELVSVYVRGRSLSLRTLSLSECSVSVSNKRKWCAPVMQDLCILE